MNQTEFNRKNLLMYFTLTYVSFWLFFALIGVAMMVLKAPVAVITIMKSLSAWTPTIIVLVLFRKLMPHLSLKAFLKRELLTSIGAGRLLIILLLQIGLFLITYFLCSFFESITIPFFKELSIASVSILALELLSSGATGEELGWRGYAYHELRKRYDFTGTAIILGLVWGFWHLPLWFVTGYTGILLVKYIVVFLVGIVATSVIISFFYERSGSLWTAILIHFSSNFLISLLAKMLQIEMYTIFLWMLVPSICVALILIIIEKHKKK